MLTGETDKLSDLVSEKKFVDKHLLQDCYGFNSDNWGDLPVFKGNYINFGYWKDISLDKLLTIEDRIQSSKSLYFHIAGQHVFDGYEKWISQIDCKTVCSHYLYKAYQKKIY